ncbi:armadillo-type protein [Russula compacta]|nr:armadillo-type protein [Russula compacta]
MSQDAKFFQRGKIQEFGQELQAAETKDKNLDYPHSVYLFLVNHGRTKADSIHMVIPNFLQDCNDRNPLIRALAIRTMSYIPIPIVLGHLTEQLHHHLKDRDPYVRKTAAICVAKLYAADPRKAEKFGVELLRDLLVDSNATIVANAVAALSEIADRPDGVVFKLNLPVTNKVIAALGKSSECMARCLHPLTEFVQEAIIVIKDIFRRYPGKYEGIILKLCENLDVLDEPEAKASMVWIIGQFANRIDNADELMDDLTYNFLEEPIEVQFALVTAAVKLFVYKSSSDSVKTLVHKDRMDRGALNQLLLHTGSLGSIYHKNPETFIRNAAGKALADSPALDPLSRQLLVPILRDAPATLGPVIVPGPGPIKPGAAAPELSEQMMDTSKPAPPLPSESGGDGGLLEREASAGEEDEDEDEDVGFAKGKSAPARQMTTTADPYASLDAAVGEYAVDAPRPGAAGQDAGLLF